jgi:transposase
MQRMLSMRDLKAQDLHGLTPDAVTALAAQMLEHIEQQAETGELEVKQSSSSARTATSPGATPRSRRSLRARAAEALEVRRQDRGDDAPSSARCSRRRCWRTKPSLRRNSPRCRSAACPRRRPSPRHAPRRPRRQALPAHLRRVEHHHEPEDTTCTTPDCGQPMTRIGEDVSERLDIVPAEFFVHRHIYGKWACRCCQRQGLTLVQEPAAPDHRRRHRRPAGLLAHT